MTSSLDGVVKIGNARDLNAETETRQKTSWGVCPLWEQNHQPHPPQQPSLYSSLEIPQKPSPVKPSKDLGLNIKPQLNA